MKYYIIDKKIISFENDLDSSLYTYPQLTDEQSAFFELHKCSLNEVLNLTLNPVYVPSLKELKIQKNEQFEQLAFDIREAKIPTYRLINASLDIYGDAVRTEYQSVINDFRTEYYRLKALIDNSATIEELNAITHNYESL